MTTFRFFKIDGFFSKSRDSLDAPVGPEMRVWRQEFVDVRGEKSRERVSHVDVSGGHGSDGVLELAGAAFSEVELFQIVQVDDRDVKWRPVE